MSLAINGSHYTIRRMPTDQSAALRLIRLRKVDGTTYYVSRHSYGLECDCPDFTFNREGIDPAGCKHVKALIACGLFDQEGRTK